MNELNYAGFWWRALALFIDSIVLLIPSLIVGVVIGIAVGLPLILSGMDMQIVKDINQLAGMIGGVILTCLYHATLESSPWQGTVGKKLLGLTVTDSEGNRISFSQALKRALARLLNGFTLGIGYLMVAFNPRKQALHDKIANTVVLKRTD